MMLYMDPDLVCAARVNAVAKRDKERTEKATEKLKKLADEAFESLDLIKPKGEENSIELSKIIKKDKIFVSVK